MKFLWAGSEFLVIERENNKIVTQTATIVFASAHVNAYAEPETGQIKIEFASASVVRFEVDDNTVIASHRRFQNSGISTIVYYGDAGENNGRSLRHDFVVLSLDHQKLASSPQEFHLP